MWLELKRRVTGLTGNWEDDSKRGGCFSEVETTGENLAGEGGCRCGAEVGEGVCGKIGWTGATKLEGREGLGMGGSKRANSLR